MATQTRKLSFRWPPRNGGRPLQVAELEPLQTQALACCADGEPAGALADARAAITDALDVHPGADAVRVAGSPDLDGLDGEAATGGSDRDRGAASAGALSTLPADRRHVSLEADHLALQLGDLDRLEAQTLAGGSW